jgi:hypothetical protein
MSVSYTVDDLIAHIKNKAAIPSTLGAGLTKEDILRYMNDEMRYYIIPLITSVREEFFVTYTDTVMGTSSTFPIPAAALGNKLRDILRIDSNGNKFSIARIEPEDLPRFNMYANYIRGFYIEGNNIKVIGNMNTTDQIRLSYFKRPNDLVLYNGTSVYGAAKISVLGGGGAVTTAVTIPSTFTTSVTYDIIKATPLFDTVVASATASTAAGTGMVLSSTTGASMGDYVCLAGESCIPQVPVECYPLLSERTVMKICQSLGDKDNYAIAKEEADVMKEMLLHLLSDRVEGENRKIINTDNLAWRNRRFWAY